MEMFLYLHSNSLSRSLFEIYSIVSKILYTLSLSCHCFHSNNSFAGTCTVDAPYKRFKFIVDNSDVYLALTILSIFVYFIVI